MIYLSMPVEGNYGWAVCGRGLAGAIPDCKVVSHASGYPTAVMETVLHGITGPNFAPYNSDIWSKRRNVGLAFIEDFATAEKYKEVALRNYDLVLTGSSWCTDKMRALGIPAKTMIQGVDHSTFCPNGAPKTQSRFLIFSGGKAEYRKGTDVVIAAFKAIMDKIPTAYLVCSWGNYWPEAMHTLSKSNVIAYYPHSNEWKQNMAAVMTDNGIPASRYAMVDILTHELMANVYRACHIGVFPNRCEAGTNLVMMEAMACGMPVIATSGTGHWDVIDGLPVIGIETSSDGWVEPSVDDLAKNILSAYENQDRLEYLGRQSRDCVAKLTWAGAASIVEEVCMQTGPRSPTKPLSKREAVVLTMLISGMSNQEISAKLNISSASISVYKVALKNKFGVSNDIQLGIAISKGELW